MRGRIFIAIFILSLVLCIQLPKTSANPSPITLFEQPNMLVLTNNSVIRFVSEIVNITVDRQQGMDVQALYTLTNPTNETVVQDILLPYVKYPMKFFGGIGENSLGTMRFNGTNIKRVQVDLDDREILEKFGLEDQLSMGGYVCNVTFGPRQTGVLQVFFRSQLACRTLVSDEPKKSQYQMIYITRSTAFWKLPLGSATIDIWIDRDIITDYPTGGGEFELLPDKAHVHFQYEDWMPTENLDLTWNCTSGEMFGTEQYGELRVVCCQRFELKNWDTSVNISILDQNGEPLPFLNDFGNIVHFQNYSSIRIWPWPFRAYLVDDYTPPGDVTLLIDPVNCSEVRITLDADLPRYDLGNITLHPIPVEKDIEGKSIFTSFPMIAIYFFGAIFLMIAIAVSILTLKERSRRKMENTGSRDN